MKKAIILKRRHRAMRCLPGFGRRMPDDRGYGYVHIRMHGKGRQGRVQLLETARLPDAEVRALAHDPENAPELAFPDALHAARGFGAGELFDFFPGPVARQMHDDVYHEQHCLSPFVRLAKSAVLF